MSDVNPALETPPKALHQPSLKRAFATAFVGNLFYTACQGAMTIALARLGPPELLGTFGIGIAVAAPVVEFFGLQLQVVESVDAKQKHSFYRYFCLQSMGSTLAMIVLFAFAMLGPLRTEAAWTVFFCGISKIIEAGSLICHGKMQQVERTEYIAASLMWRGIAGLLAIVLTVYFTSSVLLGVVAMSIAWLLVLVLYDWPQASSLELKPLSRDMINREALLGLARLAFPLGLFVGLNSLLANMPRYFVESSLGPRELGIFSALAYLGLAARSFYTSFLNAVLSRMASLHSNGEIGPFLRIIGATTLAVVLLGVGGFLVTAFFGKQILGLFGEAYATETTVLVLLTVAMAFKTLWMVFVSALYAMNRFGLIFVLQVMSGLVLTTLLARWVGSGRLEGTSWAVLIGAMFDVGLFATSVFVIMMRRRASSIDWNISVDLNPAAQVENELK